MPAESPTRQISVPASSTCFRSGRVYVSRSQRAQRATRSCAVRGADHPPWPTGSRTRSPWRSARRACTLIRSIAASRAASCGSAGSTRRRKPRCSPSPLPSCSRRPHLRLPLPRTTIATTTTTDGTAARTTSARTPRVRSVSTTPSRAVRPFGWFRRAACQATVTPSGKAKRFLSRRAAQWCGVCLRATLMKLNPQS